MELGLVVPLHDVPSSHYAPSPTVSGGLAPREGVGGQRTCGLQPRTQQLPVTRPTRPAKLKSTNSLGWVEACMDTDGGMELGLRQRPHRIQISTWGLSTLESWQV